MAFITDECTRIEDGRGALRRVGDQPERVDAERQSGMAGPRRRRAEQLHERRESIGLAADDRQRHRQSERAGTHGRGRRSANGNPDRQRLLHRTRVDATVVDRRPMLPAPGDPLGLADRQQQLELLGEQRVVVVQVLAEKRYDSMNEPRPAMISARPPDSRLTVSELLEHSHGIVGAEHGDGARQPDLARARCRRAKHHRRRQTT